MSEDSKMDSESSLPEWVTCKHSLSLLVEYLDGNLPPKEKAELDRHFKACPPCIEFVRKYRSTPGLCKQAMADELPKEAEERLTSFLRAHVCKP